MIWSATTCKETYTCLCFWNNKTETKPAITKLCFPHVFERLQPSLKQSINAHHSRNLSLLSYVICTPPPFPRAVPFTKNPLVPLWLDGIGCARDFIGNTDAEFSLSSMQRCRPVPYRSVRRGNLIRYVNLCWRIEILTRNMFQRSALTFVCPVHNPFNILLLCDHLF